MLVKDESTGRLIGHLSDISTGGFKVESTHPLPPSINFKLRIEQTGQISSKNYLVFSARSMWCQKDPYDPTMYNIGFKIVDMLPSDYDVYVKMFNLYGTIEVANDKNKTDYLWR
jgi:hypothetical protein